MYRSIHSVVSTCKSSVFHVTKLPSNQLFSVLLTRDSTISHTPDTPNSSQPKKRVLIEPPRLPCTDELPSPETLSGVIAIHKPLGWTSQDVVSKIKHTLVHHYISLFPPAFVEWNSMRLIKSKIKVGHGGTLDPLAEGVLIVGIGKGTKRLQSYLSTSKRYHACAKLGAATDTLDISGEVVSQKDAKHVTSALIEEQLGAFRGKITQIPPMYSAIKKNGIKLYELARAGQEIEREAREVTVYELSLVTEYSQDQLNDNKNMNSDNSSDSISDGASKTDDIHPYCFRNHLFSRPTLLTPPEGFVLSIECSGGFYVRSLIDDVAKRMDTLAYMTALTRTKQGLFDLHDCLPNQPVAWTVPNIVANLQHCQEKIEKHGVHQSGTCSDNNSEFCDS